MIRCSRRCVIIFLLSLILLGIIIAIVLIILWKKSQTTTNKPGKSGKKFEIIIRCFVLATEVFLRWNTTGITLFGTIRGNASNQFYNPFGLLINSYNDFYIADRKNNRIQKCRSGELTCTTIAGQANAESGINMSYLNGPTYMYLDSNNGLYIADSGNQRVQYWSYGASYGTTIAGVASRIR